MPSSAGCQGRSTVSPYRFKPSRHSSHALLLASLPEGGEGRRVLDVGCGDGYLSAILAERGYQVVAIDRSLEARATLPESVQFIEADLDQGVPVEGGGFSYIVCADVLEHLREPQRVLGELRSLLAPEGRLLASLPNSGNLYFRLNVLLGRFPKHDRGLFDRSHLHFYTWRGWAECLARSGFRIEKQRPTSVPVSLALPKWEGTLGVRMLECLSFLLARLWKKMFAYQFVVVARAEGAAGNPAATGVPISGTLRLTVHPRSTPAAGEAPAAKPKVVVVMPAYNAARTLPMTYAELPHELVDLVILVDDGSSDDTVRVARELGVAVFTHNRNYGYGANQKTCYREALKAGAEIVVMVHPDYQYDPALLPEIIRPIQEGRADIVLGSRLLGASPIQQGMPWWKYYSNRVLTRLENVAFRRKLSEYHTGYRAFRREVLESVNFPMNSDGFIFDQEILAQAVELGARIAEVPVPTRYFPLASSASFPQSVVYGLRILWLLARYGLHRAGLLRQRQFESLTHRYMKEPGGESRP